MKDKSAKKIFGHSRPWKPIPLPAAPMLPQLPPPASSKPAPIKSDYRREVFEPILTRPIELDKFAVEVVLQFRDLDAEYKVRTCYSDIYKIVNALMDYARTLELVCDEWNLSSYHRAVYEIHAEKLRSIAKKYQEAIGYDYEATLAKCEAKRKKQRTDGDVGADGLELAIMRGKRKSKKKEK